jgi:hypothetical protein
VTGANPEKMEPNPEENEAVLGRQEILKEEVAIHSLKVCRNETTTSKGAADHIQRRLSPIQE